MRKFVGPLLLALVGLSMIGAAYSEPTFVPDPRAPVTVTVTTPVDLALVPWRPVAGILGTTYAVMFNDLFFTSGACEKYLKTAPFRQSYAGLVAFLATHTGQRLAAPVCAQVPPSTPPPPPLGAGEEI